MFAGSVCVVVVVILGLAPAVITPFLAVRKGFAWYLWVLSAGVAGLVVLAFLPSAADPDRGRDEAAGLRKAGNAVGGVLSGVFIAGMVLTTGLTVAGRVW